MGRKRTDKKTQKNIAKTRINILFNLAEKNALDGKIKLANRYVEIARKISMKYLVPIPKEFKRCFCKNCYSYMLPNITCRVRIHHGKIVFFCKNCQRVTRIPIKK